MIPECYTRKIKLSYSLLSWDCLENGLWEPEEWIKDAEWKAEKLLTFHKINKYFKLSQAPTSSVLEMDF